MTFYDGRGMMIWGAVTVWISGGLEPLVYRTSGLARIALHGAIYNVRNQYVHTLLRAAM